MHIKVLVPCVDKTIDQVKELAAFLRVDSDAIFLNQNGADGKEAFSLNGHNIEVIFTKAKGVSMARNLLIKNANCDVGLFIDDDCVLSSGYVQEIEKAYDEFPSADAIRFNTARTYWNPVNAHATKDCKAGFRDLSSFGVVGLSFRPSVFASKLISFDEHLGAPNYLFNGEDSVFLFDLCQKSQEVYQSSFYICEVKETKKSSWFEKFDKRYFVTKGYVYTHLYGINWPFALARMYLKYRKDYHLSYAKVRKYAALGHVMYKEHFYEEPKDD
jgi:glycosyltransferase involved in cell wall biosynthesis